MKKSVIENVPLDAIEATAATQVRVRIDKEMVDQYTEDLKNGCQFPPLTCFREQNSERIILADGFHRHRAAVNAGLDSFEAEIHVGDTRDALIFALGANYSHGFRRSNADKLHAIDMALKDPVLSKMTSQEIADVCRVAKRTVERRINDHLVAGENGKSAKSKKKKPKKPKSEDFRGNGKELTQEQVDLGELREAMSAIKKLPYDGDTAAGKLDFNQDDVADCEYVSTWLASVVINKRGVTGFAVVTQDAEDIPDD